MICVHITRDHHPLQGRSLQVLGQMHCRGRLELLLVLPDGSKSLVPAAWTDYAADSQPGAGAEPAECGVLGALADLAEARVVVSALLARTIDQPEQAARHLPRKEDDRAARPTQSAPRAVTPAAESADRPAPAAAAAGGHLTARPSHRQDDRRTPKGGRR